MMTGNLKHKPTTRRDAADAVRLKAEGDPAHINAHEARLLHRLMPEAAGPVITKGLLAEAGRRGDDRITKLIPAEAALLKSRGGSGTVNPATGLLQYYGDGDNDGGMSGGEGTNGPSDGGTDTGGDTMGGDTSNDGGYGGYTSFGNYTSDPSMGPAGYDDEMGLANGTGTVNWNDYAIDGYAKPDTFGRLMQELVSPSVPTAKYGATTGTNLGIMGAMAGMLTGGPMSGLMGLGQAMGRAQSPESQRASMAEQAATGAKNSTGQDSSASMAAGSASGASTAAPLAESLRGNAGAVPPGFTLNPAGQLIPLPQQGNNRPAYQDPIRNLLLDYVLRGRQGGGLLG